MQISPDLVDAIIDWVDQDEVPEPAGAESLSYQTLRPSYRAANTSLQTLSDLRLMRGMTPDIIEKLSKVLTVYPLRGESKVNVNTADPLVIQALDPRITQSMAAEIVQARPFKAIQELDRVSSFEDIGKELHQRNLYHVKSDLFLARMMVRVNEVTRNGLWCSSAISTLEQAQCCTTASSYTCHSNPALATEHPSGRPGQRAHITPRPHCLRLDSRR